MIHWLNVVIITILSLLNNKVSEVHDFHASLTEISENSKTNTLEISIRLFSDDFETELMAVNQIKKILVDAEDEASQEIISKYIRKNFAFISKNNEVSFPKYLGKEIQKDAIWIYLEMNIPPDLSELYIYNNLLNFSFDDQSNMVTVLKNSQKKSFMFTKTDKTYLYPY